MAGAEQELFERLSAFEAQDAGTQGFGKARVPEGQSAADLLASLTLEDQDSASAGSVLLIGGEIELSPVRRFAPEDFAGAGQFIVVIDDGYSPLYDQANTSAEFDFFGARDDPDASVEKLDSHGSWVAQTALGVAPEADIIHFKVFPDEGGSAYMSDIEQALDAAIELSKTVAIAAVNLSLGYGNTTVETPSILADEIATLEALGIATVAAAGNSGRQHEEGVSILAANPEVIAVSATTASGAFAGFSQRDPDLTDISAIGTDIVVETIDGAQGEVAGTSFSAPYVSGALALLQEAAGTLLGGRLAVEDALEIIQESGEPVRGAAAADGYRVADADEALAYFLDNSADYADSLLV